MARPILQVVHVLRNTANELKNRSDYQWGHMGSCNCGFLAQQVTRLRKNEIHTYAMQRYGDWNEQLNDYCPTSGLGIDDLISEMIAFGFDTDDLKHLEKLCDASILQSLPFEERNLKHNVKADVIKYLMTWADLLEAKLLDGIKLPLLHTNQVVV